MVPQKIFFVFRKHFFTLISDAIMKVAVITCAKNSAFNVRLTFSEELYPKTH